MDFHLKWKGEKIEKCKYKKIGIKNKMALFKNSITQNGIQCHIGPKMGFYQGHKTLQF